MPPSPHPGGKTKYTAVDGIPELKQAILRQVNARHGLTTRRAGQRRNRRQADPSYNALDGGR